LPLRRPRPGHLSPVAEATRYSKGQVSRAGVHLAARLEAVRAGERAQVIDPRDEADVAAAGVVRWWRDEHIGPMLAVRRRVAHHAAPLWVGDEEVQVVSSRRKRLPTIIDKLLRESVRLADMTDLGGVRAVVGTQREADELAGRLSGELEIRRVRDWARNPRSSGYRALHLHVRHAGRMIEVQLRTFGQDAWANLVEEESLLAGTNYKAEHGPREVLDLFRLLGDLLGAIELGEEHLALAVSIAAAHRRAKPFLRTPLLAKLDV
jgi:putative GTP pyrophosphokinase